MLPTGSGKKMHECAGSFTTIHIEARVLYIDYFESREVCFKPTTDTVKALTEHHRDLCRDNLKARSCDDVTIEAEIKGLMDNFELAVKDFHYRTGIGYLDEMEANGSGELTAQHSAEVKSTILDFFGPYERYLSTFPELLRDRLGTTFHTALFGLQHLQPFSQTRGSDAQASAEITTSHQPTRP